jgi:hypothetical protein
MLAAPSSWAARRGAARMRLASGCVWRLQCASARAPPAHSALSPQSSCRGDSGGSCRAPWQVARRSLLHARRFVVFRPPSGTLLLADQCARMACMRARARASETGRACEASLQRAPSHARIHCARTQQHHAGKKRKRRQPIGLRERSSGRRRPAPTQIIAPPSSSEGRLPPREALALCLLFSA